MHEKKIRDKTKKNFFFIYIRIEGTKGYYCTYKFDIFYVEKNKKLEICVHDHDKCTHTLHTFSGLTHNEYHTVRRKIMSKVAEVSACEYNHVNSMLKERQTA